MARRLIEVAIIGDARSVEAAFGKAATASMKLQQGLAPIAKGAKRTLLGLGALGVVTGKMANDFNLTASRIVGLAGVGEKQVDNWKDALLELAPAVGKAPKELAEALYFVSSSGVAASKALGVVEVSAKAASAGLGETQSVADAVTSAMNAYAGVNLSAAAATDVLVATVREGKGEAADIAPVLGNVVPIAAQLGVSFGEVGAAMASMTRLGFDAATAATNLSGVFNALLKPAKDSKEALHDIGTSSAEVQQMLAKRGLLSTLQFLSKAFDGNASAIARVFRDVRGFRAVLALVGKSAEGTAGVFDRMKDSTGSLDHAFNAIDPQAKAMQSSLAELQAEGIKLGQSFVPVGTAIIGTVADIAGAMGEHRTATLGAAAAIGVLSTAVIGANTALKIYNSQLVASLGMRGALLGIGAAAGPIGLVVAGLAAGAIAAKAFGDNTSVADRAMQNAASSARDYKAALDDLKGANRDHREAVLGVKRAELEVDRAQKTRRETLKSFGKGTLEARDANLRYREAVNALERAEERERSTNQKANDTRVRISSGAHKAADSLKDLRDAVVDQLTPMERLAKARGDDATAAQRSRIATNKARTDLQEFTVASAGLARQLGGTETKAGRAATAVFNLAQRLGRVPTKREIDIALNTAEAYAQLGQIHDRITTPVYLPVILRPSGTTGVQERAAGGPVAAGGAYIVGERRPELLVMGRRGGYVHRSVPAGMRSGGGLEGGTFELVITDWDRGLGKISRVAGAQDAAHARIARQRQRMGA